MSGKPSDNQFVRKAVVDAGFRTLGRLAVKGRDTAGESIEANSRQSPFARIIMGSGMDSEG
ncbi:hypothetical protein [Azospirillum melinis]